jgi:hypothetical protein
MNQLEKVILNTGFNRNSKIGVVLAHLFQQETSIGMVAVQYGSFLHFPPVAAKAAGRGKFKRGLNRSAKLVLVIPQLRYEIRNNTRIINRVVHYRYFGPGLNVKEVFVRDKVAKLLGKQEKENLISILPPNTYLSNLSTHNILNKISSYVSTMFPSTAKVLILKENSNNGQSKNNSAEFVPDMFNKNEYNQFKGRQLHKIESQNRAILQVIRFSEPTSFEKGTFGLKSVLSFTNITTYPDVYSSMTKSDATSKNISNKNVNSIKIVTNNDTSNTLTSILKNKQIIKVYNYNQTGQNTEREYFQSFHLLIKSINPQPLTYFSHLTRRENLAYTDNVTVRLNSHLTKSEGQFGLSRSLSNNLSFQNNSSSPLKSIQMKQLQKREISVQIQKPVPVSQSTSNWNVLRGNRFEIEKNTKYYPLEKQNNFTLTDNKGYTAVPGVLNNIQRRNFINLKQFMFNMHGKLINTMFKTQNVSIKNIEYGVKANFFEYVNRTEHEFTKTNNGFMSAEQIDLQHVSLTANTPNSSNIESILNNCLKTGNDVVSSSTSKVVLRKPQGITDLPEEFLAKNQIGVLADTIISIIEDKYQTEAKRKGLL